MEPERDMNSISSWQGPVRVDGKQYDVVVTEMPCNKTNQVYIRCTSKSDPTLPPFEGTMTVTSNQKNHAYVHKRFSCYYERLAVKYCTDFLKHSNERHACDSKHRYQTCRRGEIAQIEISPLAGERLYRVDGDCEWGGCFRERPTSRCLPRSFSQSWPVSIA